MKKHSRSIRGGTAYLPIDPRFALSSGRCVVSGGGGKTPLGHRTSGTSQINPQNAIVSEPATYGIGGFIVNPNQSFFSIDSVKSGFSRLKDLNTCWLNEPVCTIFFNGYPLRVPGTTNKEYNYDTKRPYLCSFRRILMLKSKHVRMKESTG